MKKSKNKIGILVFLIIINPLLPDYIGNYYRYLLMLFLVLSVWGIYARIQIRKSKNKNQLRISTNNDDYAKILPFIFGSFLFFGGLAFYYHSDAINIENILIIILGFLLLIIGFLPVPTGLVEIKKGMLKFINGSRNMSFKIEKVKKIEFQKSYILITENNKDIHIVNYMNLIENDYKTIKYFLVKNSEITFEILQ
ncbi:MAG: hypothetical protein QM499_10945 [Flavobacteriaceae bacterium]